MKDLFGNDCTEKDFEPRPKTMIERGLRKFNYRKSEEKDRCCRSCERSFKRAGRFYKCELVGCTSSIASDIRAFNVCDAWKKKEW